MEININAETLSALAIGEILQQFPIAEDFLQNLNLPSIDFDKTLEAAANAADEVYLEEFGIVPAELAGQLAKFLSALTGSDTGGRQIEFITVMGGRDKSDAAENVTLTLRSGSVVSVVGPTGSGKSRLLNDIECLAQGDTPSGRSILLNGDTVSEEERFGLSGKIVAQLSQNMNFVMDLTVSEFLELHARSRASDGSDTAETIKRCFECANSLAGEKFTLETKVTELSGGQSRALMIADTAYMSRSAIVLIDEIENAGVDRIAAIKLLAGRDKIVLISTHDPLLALGADKRVVIRNGGIASIIETSDDERLSLEIIEKMDRRTQEIRNKLRRGDVINSSELQEEMQ